jgi:hypothetical protein
MKLLIFCLLLCSGAFAFETKDYGYLTKENQPYFKNESFEGNNQVERVDLNVKEINKLHGEIKSLKAEVDLLKKDLIELKKKK